MLRTHPFFSGLLLCFVALAATADRPAAEEVYSSPVPPPAMATPETEPMRPVTTTHENGNILETPEQLPGGKLTVREIDFPRRGTQMNKVQAQLGHPLEIVPSVGEPPITKWVYGDRIIYFEFEHVIHAVASR